ncbi:MAG: DNA polymerase III subunit gamma/tau [Verrucomicrobiaceae bacterium]|nr:DNA polymerase III subunit gamma/tau [Verrucomicrobiaceae bacterium]
MSYQVFARKYRPQTFADVLGQDHVVRTLRNAIAQNRLAHAYLFVGPRGTGKTSTARIFAKALCCKEGPSVDFDPNDELCQEIAEGRSLDVLEIDGASNNGVEQVRDLREKAIYAPARCRFKIYYIDEVHMLSAAAFNALLKTLEEPPPHVKFIFATTEANKILPTIISRCQRFDLRRIPNTIIAKHLLHIAALEKVNLDEKAAYAIAKGADGGMRDAQSMLDQLVAFCGGEIHEENVLEIFGFTAAEAVAALAQCILSQDTVGALRAVHDQNEAGKDLARYLADLIQHFRTLLVQQADPEAAAEDLSPEVAQQVVAQARMATTEQLLRVVDGLGEVDARMRWAGNKRLHFELGVIQAVQSMGEVSLSDVIEALDRGSSSGGAGTPVAAKRTVVPMQQPAPVVRTAPSAQQAPAAQVARPVVKEEPPAVSREMVSSKVPDHPEKSDEPGQSVAAPQSVESSALWSALTHEVEAKRPLLAHWVHMGAQMEHKPGLLRVGFPKSEAHACESLKREDTRKFLEGLLGIIAGAPTRLELVVDSSLVAPPQPEPMLSFEPPAAAPKPAAKTPEPTAAATVATEPSGDPDFYNDPLIKATIEAFKARPISAKPSA